MESQTVLAFALAGLTMVSIISHNYFSAALGLENPVLFPLALAYVFAFPFYLVYCVYTYKTKGKPGDLWKVGFLGLLGLVGVLPGLSTSFFGLFGLFGFFGLKK